MGTGQFKESVKIRVSSEMKARMKDFKISWPEYARRCFSTKIGPHRYQTNFGLEDLSLEECFKIVIGLVGEVTDLDSREVTAVNALKGFIK